MINSDYIKFGSFTKDKYNNYEEPEYDLVLRRMTGEPMAELETENFRIHTGLSGVDQISFSVYKSYMDSTGVMVDNYLYDMIEGNMLVEVNEMKYFILSKPTVVVDEDDKIPYKSITGYSREYELTQKLITGYEGNSKAIYDPSNTLDKNGIEEGFLNYVENNTSWKVGYVNTEIAKKYRYLNIQTSNIYQSFEEIQKAFGCLLQFDTINKIIDVYDIEQIGKNQGIYISDENYIQSMEQEIEDEDIVTRLYLYGKDGISVQSLNITGQPYIEDYTYFMNEKYMSKGLIDGLLSYNKAISSKQGQFTQFVKELNAEDEKLFDLEVELVDEDGKLTVLLHELDIKLSDTSKPSLTTINRQISNQETIIKNLETKISNVKSTIKSINQKISTLRKDINLGDFLTSKQIDELDYFIKEERFSNSNYTEHNLKELLEEGEKVLKKISKPSLTFTVNVDDFLTIAEGRFIKDKFILGDIINLEHKGIGFDYEVKLIAYEHTPKEELLLTFSNVDNVYDSSIYLEQVLENAVNVGNTVDFNKYKWDKGEDVSNEFSEFIAHNLDLSNQALAKAEGQKPMLDDRGLWLYKENPDGTTSPEQIRAINNVLAITKDNWETTEWALTPNGIMANKLIGDMILGTDLKIISDNGVMEMLNNVLNVRDDRGRLRVSLGNYTGEKYGLRIMDKSGNKTVLDEDGMLQVWQEGNVENVGSGNPLVLNVYIPKHTKSIHESLLRFKRLPFRAYSQSVGSKPSFTSGSSSRSTTSQDRTMTTGGNDLTTTRSSSRNTTYNKKVDIDITTVSYFKDPTYNLTTNPFDKVDHGHGVEDHGHVLAQDAHRHDMEHYHKVDDHEHDFYHSHDISHTHQIPKHEHGINFGIYTNSNYVPKNIKIYINGDDRTYAISNYNSLNSDYADLNITKYLQVGRWNTIELRSSTLGRIDATIFMQALVGFN